MLGQQLLKQGLPLRALGQGLQLFAVTQAHRAFEAHAAKLPCRPSHRGQGFVKTPARHGHRAQAVALAQHHAQQWHTQMRRCHKHARDMAHLGRGFGVRAHHEAGRVHQTHDGQCMRIAQLHEAGRFVGRIGVDRTTQVQRVVGHQAHRAACNAGQGGVDAHAKPRAQMQQAALVCNALHGRACVVHPQAVFRDHMAQGLGRGRLPLRWCPLKKRQVMPRCRDRLHFVIDQHVDHTVAMLHLARADLLGLEHAQATAFDHGRAAHADVAAPCGDDHVAAAQQRCVARKAAPSHHAQHRHPAVEPRKRCEGGQVQTGHDGDVDITRSAATALGKQHHRQLVSQGHTQHAVGLLVVAHALCARQHREVVGHDHHALAIDAADACDHAVRWGVSHQIVCAAAPTLCGHGQGAVLHKGIGITQRRDVFAGRAQALRVALGHGFGASSVVGEGQAGLQLLQVRALAQRWRRLGDGSGGLGLGGCIGHGHEHN